MTLGTQLRALRLTAGYNQTELSELADIGRTTISDVERDARPTTTDVLERWVKTCHGSIEIKGIKEEEGPEELTRAASVLDEEELALCLRVVQVLGRVQGRERVIALRQLGRLLEDFEVIV